MQQLINQIITNLPQLEDSAITVNDGITITRADFDRVADGNSLNDILSCLADMQWVALRLAVVAMLRQNNEVSDAPMIFVSVFEALPKIYVTIRERAVIVVARNGVYEVWDCAVHNGIHVKFVQRCVTRADALILARDWVRHYQS